MIDTGQLKKQILTSSFESLPNYLYEPLGNHVIFERGITFPASEKKAIREIGTIPCIRTANIQENLDISDLIYVSERFVKNNKKLIRSDDIFISMANSRELVGKSCMVSENTEQMTFGGFVTVARSIDVHQRYLYFYLKYLFISSKMLSIASQTTNIANISSKSLQSLSIPLPPLEEQKRIVAKIEELFAKIDEIDKAQKELKELAELAEKKVLDMAVLPPLEEQKRIVAKIEELFAKIDEIDKAQKELKELAELAEKKVLDMAVRGELVEQDASEGTAADILNQIREDYKTRKTNKWQKTSLSHKIGSFNIPASWQWTSIEEIVDGIIIGKDKPKDCSEIRTKDKQIPVVANGIQNDGIVGYTSMSSLSTGKVVTVAGRGSIGYPIVRNYPFYPIVRLIVLKPNRNIDCDYLSLVLFCLREEGSGTAINQLTAPMIREKQIPLPPLLEQKRISNIYNRFKSFKTRLTD